MELENLSNYTSTQFKDYVHKNWPDMFEVFDTVNADIMSVDNHMLDDWRNSTPAYIVGKDTNNKASLHYSCTLFLAPDASNGKRGCVVVCEQGKCTYFKFFDEDVLLNILKGSTGN